jgi:hypothetical protein
MKENPQLGVDKMLAFWHNGFKSNNHQQQKRREVNQYGNQSEAMQSAEL